MENYNIHTRKRYKIFFLLSGMIITGGCGMDINSNNYIKEIIYYNKGSSSIINIKDYNINECFNNISEQFTLLITEESINHIKQNENAIEILFKKSVKYTLKPLDKTKTFDKAFVPTNGRYKKMLFLGNENGYGAYTPYGLVDCDLVNNYQKAKGSDPK